MTKGTLYKSVKAGEPLRTRVIFPVKLVEHYKLDIKLSDPDSHFPSEFEAGPFVPAFQYEDGTTLTESIPIALMLVDQIKDKGTLYGNGSEADKAQILSWMSKWNLDFMNALANQFRMSIGRLPADKDLWDRLVAKVDKFATALNDHLTKNTYFVGETVTLADLYGAPMLLRAVSGVWGPQERAKYPALMRWFNTVKNDKFFNNYFDSLEFASEPTYPKF